MHFVFIKQYRSQLKSRLRTFLSKEWLPYRFDLYYQYQDNKTEPKLNKYKFSETLDIINAYFSYENEYEMKLQQNTPSGGMYLHADTSDVLGSRLITFLATKVLRLEKENCIQYSGNPKHPFVLPCKKAR